MQAVAKWVLAGCLVLPAVQVCAEDLYGRVVAVFDGDTIKILDATNRQITIRLSEIDAPEKGQAFGQASRRALSDLVARKHVVASCPSTDRYGRHVCTVTADGLNVNSRQVQTGMAWVYRQYAKTDSPLLRIEKEARAGGYGLWRDTDPVPPWEWRKARR